jgi:hypothetical protein
MAVHHVQQRPVVPGWIIGPVPTPDGTILVAHRIADLTDYQVAHGCTAKVQADGPDELVVRCLAQWALAELLAAAETAPKRARKGAVHAAWHAYGVLMERVLRPQEATA